ncbi:hypothetical protein [Phaeobacter sp. B1627]|uniref:hypothetical protein n=1 Tax=Phaeobacter sp. B1627 TaxID=2583809 RepID=UPI00111AC929|nr:hypothetical protein [Phaeobacter sp. B1627]TNJ48483.1 hypothetical protein FGE21_00615 [Phaeobacter sp. B1627]
MNAQAAAETPSRTDQAAPKEPTEERISVRISPKTRQLMNEIKTAFGFKTDADVIRYALSTQHRIGQSLQRNERIYVGDQDNNILSELVFVHQ